MPLLLTAISLVPIITGPCTVFSIDVPWYQRQTTIIAYFISHRIGLHHL